MELQVATCSYTAYERIMGLPVRISGSAPRWAKLPSERFGTFTRWPVVRGMVPAADYVGITDDEEFRSRYVGQLNELRDSIEAELKALADLHKAPLVLCCFEKELPTPHTCHRTIAARWLEEQFGLSVPELGEGR